MRLSLEYILFKENDLRNKLDLFNKFIIYDKDQFYKTHDYCNNSGYLLSNSLLNELGLTPAKIKFNELPLNTNFESENEFEGLFNILHIKNEESLVKIILIYTILINHWHYQASIRLRSHIRISHCPIFKEIESSCFLERLLTGRISNQSLIEELRYFIYKKSKEKASAEESQVFYSEIIKKSFIAEDIINYILEFEIKGFSFLENRKSQLLVLDTKSLLIELDKTIEEILNLTP